MNKDKLIKKYQLLIALSKNQETEEEITAARLAEELKEKYNLSTEEVKVKTKNYGESQKVITLINKKYWQVWILELISRRYSLTLVEEISVGSESGVVGCDYFMIGCNASSINKIQELYNKYYIATDFVLKNRNIQIKADEDLELLVFSDENITEQDDETSFVMGIMDGLNEIIFTEPDLEELSETIIGGANLATSPGQEIQTDLPEPPAELKNNTEQVKEINPFEYYMGLSAIKLYFTPEKEDFNKKKSGFKRAF